MIHVIVFKIMIETVNWNWVSVFFGAACFISYYGMVFVMNFDMIAPLIQPEINNEFNIMFVNVKAIIVMVLIPFVALLPDMVILMVQKIFFPTPTDAVMQKQRQNPNYAFDGWAGVYVPPLPTRAELERQEAELLAE